MAKLYYALNEDKGYVLRGSRKEANEWIKDNGYINKYNLKDEEVDKIMKDYANGLFNGEDISEVDVEDSLDDMKQTIIIYVVYGDKALEEKLFDDMKEVNDWLKINGHGKTFDAITQIEVTPIMGKKFTSKQAIELINSKWEEEGGLDNYDTKEGVALGLFKKT